MYYCTPGNTHLSAFPLLPYPTTNNLSKFHVPAIVIDVHTKPNYSFHPDLVALRTLNNNKFVFLTGKLLQDNRQTDIKNTKQLNNIFYGENNCFNFHSVRHFQRDGRFRHQDAVL